MGLFPTDAVNGQQVTNAKGTVFEYDDVEDKWFIVFETDVYTQAQVDALIPVAGDFDHDDIANPQGNADEQHLTAAQVAALHATYTDAQAAAKILADDDYIKLAGDILTAGAYLLAQGATISFDAEQNDTTYSGFCIDIDTTGCNLFDLVYVDGNDSVAPADATDDTKMPAIGIVVAAGKVLTHGTVKDDDLIKCTTGKAVVYASTTLREVTETAPNGDGNMIQVVGVCVGDHTLFVNLSLDMVKFKV